MAQPIELVPLVCVKCSTPIPAAPDEAAWACAQCGQGMSLDPQTGLQALPIYCDSRLNTAAPGKPYWVVDAQVVTRRETYKGGSSESEAQQFWAQPRRFFLPAYDCSFEVFLQTGMAMLMNNPTLQPGPAARFAPVTLLMEDIRPSVELIVITIEAGRKDRVKKLDVSVKLTQPALWILDR